MDNYLSSQSAAVSVGVSRRTIYNRRDQGRYLVHGSKLWADDVDKDAGQEGHHARCMVLHYAVLHVIDASLKAVIRAGADEKEAARHAQALKDGADLVKRLSDARPEAVPLMCGALIEFLRVWDCPILISAIENIKEASCVNASLRRG